MYVDQNKILLAFLLFIVANFGFATNDSNNQTNTNNTTTTTTSLGASPINIVGLFKNKVVILDQSQTHRILNVGDITEYGLKLMSANSSMATFQDVNGNLMFIGISNDNITSTYNNKKNKTVSIKLNDRNQYITDVAINGNNKVRAIIDTGANFITLNKTMADQLGLYYKNLAAKVDVATAANEKSIGYKVTLKHVAIETINLSNIEAIVMDDNNSPEIILIGMSFLKNLDIQYLGDALELQEHQINNADKATAVINKVNTEEQKTQK